MRFTSDKRQKNQLVLAFLEESRSEAPTASEEGTETLAAKRKTESPAIGERLMEEVCEKENCKQALARVKANKGSPGVLLLFASVCWLRRLLLVHPAATSAPDFSIVLSSNSVSIS